MRRVTPDTIAVVDLAVCDRCGLCLPLCPPEAIHLELNILPSTSRRALGVRNASRPARSRALAMVAYA
jgi:ferredoxin